MQISKTLLIAGTAFILAGILTFSVINGIYKRKMAKIENSYTAQIVAVNSEAIAAKQRADSLDFVVVQYQYVDDSLETISNHSTVENNTLYNSSDSVLSIVEQAPYDENYNYLQEERYPTEDTLKYPFAGSQVKDITIDVVAGDYKDSIINNYKNLEQTLRLRIEKNAEIIDLLNNERQGLEIINADLRNQLADKIKELNLSEEEAAMLRRRVRRITAGGTGVGLGLLALLILL